MRRTSPPILNDSRISCFVTTMPLVSIGGTAGPWRACSMRTGVARAASGALALPQPASSSAAAIAALVAPPKAGMRVPFLLLAFMRRSKGQGARGSGVVELGLAGEHFESGDVEIQFGAGEARTRVDEFHLADHAFVALAAGDAKRGARRVGTRGCG